MKRNIIICLIAFISFKASAQQNGSFNGIDVNMDNLYRLSNAKSRSISPENFTGVKGEGGKATTGTGAGPAKELGQGWKLSPSVVIKSKTTFTMALIENSDA